MIYIDTVPALKAPTTSGLVNDPSIDLKDNVLSSFIIPGRHIELLATVGQGKWNFIIMAIARALQIILCGNNE